MKKIIIILLAFAIVISSIAVPANTVNAETTDRPEVFDGETQEATETPTATETPDDEDELDEDDEDEPDEPEDLFVPINIFGESYSCKNGGTVEVTKGFTQPVKLSGPQGSIKYKGTVKWISSDTSIATVKTKKVARPGGEFCFSGNYCIITGKKYGKATLTAKYEGITTKVSIKVVENEYSGKIKDLHRFQSWEARTGKKTEIGIKGVTSAKFNKKGNLVIKYYEKVTKWTKYGRKISYRSIPTYDHAVSVTIDNEKAKTVLNCKVYIGKGKNHVGRTLSVQHPTASGTITISKKKLKGRRIDLRRGFFMAGTTWHSSCGDIKKAYR